MAEGGDAARHRCSPTSLRMVLEGWGEAVPERFYETCRHGAFDRFFGLWPQILRRSSAYSATGVLQLFPLSPRLRSYSMRASPSSRPCASPQAPSPRRPC